MITTSDGLRLDRVRHEGGPETVVLVHGITADLDENGLFTALAPRLTAAGFTVLRFSFRGHGRSDGRPRDMIVAGELLDCERRWLRWACPFRRWPRVSAR